MRTDLIAVVRPALVLTMLFALLLGVAYPLALTGVGQLLFAERANGSLIRDDSGRVRGSRLIGQAFSGAEYFHGRPSAAGEGYDALASSGSNLGPTSRVLVERVTRDLQTIQTSPTSPPPANLVTASASGLDPHITPNGALYQVQRVATARGVSVDDLKAVIAAHTERPLFGFIGEPRVNVLELNLALDLALDRSAVRRATGQ